MSERNQQDALNNAGWVLHDEIRQILGDVPAKLFNNLKPCLQKAIDRYEADLKPVTAPWNGPEDGLPPVGLEVEVLWNSIKGEYVTGKILAHDEGRAVYRFTSGDRKGEYQSEGVFFSTGMGGLPNFRPIRTAEQRAAEERKEAIRQMFNCAQMDFSQATRGEAVISALGALYDAGYRKVEQP